MEYVTPDYLNGNLTGQYQPETWLDEVVDINDPKKIIQKGTDMDAAHFNHMEQGIHNNSLMLAILLEAVKRNTQSVAAVEGELIEATLINSKGFYFNNSEKTIALNRMRNTLDYRVLVEVQGNPSNVGEVKVYDKQLNGFKIAYTGSASSVSVKCYVQGGVS